MSQNKEASIKTNRVGFFRALFTGAVLPFAVLFLGKLPGTRRLRRYLRPPGAQQEEAFLSACIRCGQCANVCPNQCITLAGLETGLAGLAAPVITARAQACILCMACTQVCPTGALQPLEPTEAGRQTVSMGTAVVLEDVCYSYAGRTCGVCYRACPLPGKAMKLGLYETPIVNPEHCVGCGLCEQACVHMPQAIRIIPASQLAQEEVHG
ncbi:MAG: 4Fe-4S dicluster domain-containing protein [Verrucomicrobiota bacterium]|nr:4Fe-4S dicluster domain-containing protein [Verrucomicrobiota bacterium]